MTISIIRTIRNINVRKGTAEGSGYFTLNKLVADNFSLYISPRSGICKISKFINFGSCNQFIVSEENSYSLKSCFNSGQVGLSFKANTLNTVDSINNYEFSPLSTTHLEQFKSITNYSQITSDFFINTIGLDPEKWNLSYINIQDEYGLPMINY